jgi:curved DNA-binding protein CbpA
MKKNKILKFYSVVTFCLLFTCACNKNIFAMEDDIDGVDSAPAPVRVTTAPSASGPKCVAELLEVAREAELPAFEEALTRFEQKTFYERLACAKETFDKEAIKRTYRKYALFCHPDKVAQSSGRADLGDIASRLFKAVSEAYGILSDDDKRAQYDRQGNTVGIDVQDLSPEALWRSFEDQFGEVFAVHEGEGGLGSEEESSDEDSTDGEEEGDDMSLVFERKVQAVLGSGLSSTEAFSRVFSAIDEHAGERVHSRLEASAVDEAMRPVDALLPLWAMFERLPGVSSQQCWRTFTSYLKRMMRGYVIKIFEQQAEAVREIKAATKPDPDKIQDGKALVVRSCGGHDPIEEVITCLRAIVALFPGSHDIEVEARAAEQELHELLDNVVSTTIIGRPSTTHRHHRHRIRRHAPFGSGGVVEGSVSGEESESSVSEESATRSSSKSLEKKEGPFTVKRYLLTNSGCLSAVFIMNIFMQRVDITHGITPAILAKILGGALGAYTPWEWAALIALCCVSSLPSLLRGGYSGLQAIGSILCTCFGNRWLGLAYGGGLGGLAVINRYVNQRRQKEIKQSLGRKEKRSGKHGR